MNIEQFKAHVVQVCSTYKGPIDTWHLAKSLTWPASTHPDVTVLNVILRDSGLFNEHPYESLTHGSKFTFKGNNDNANT